MDHIAGGSASTGPPGGEGRIRAVLDGLRTVLDSGDPQAVLSAADARAIADVAWGALAAVLAESGNDASAELVKALQRLGEIDQLLLRTRETDRANLSQRLLGQVLAQLEAAPCSVSELVGLAPQLIGDLGFDRAIISDIVDGVWISRSVFVVDDPEWAEAINHVGQEHPQPLVPGLFETEIVRRRKAIVVSDVQHESRVHRAIADASRSRSYVAAPLVSRGRVVALLHADRFLQGRDTDELDREVLNSFAQGLRLALSRASVAERLHYTGEALKTAVADVDVALSDIHQLSLGISAVRDPADSPAQEEPLRRVMPRAPRSVRSVLTGRETEVLELMGQGHTNASIAATLVISEGTVKQHVKHILRKLRASNRAEAVSRLYQSSDR